MFKVEEIMGKGFCPRERDRGMTWGSAATFAQITDVPSYRIQTWALEEARRRLEAEGILPDPDDEGKS